MPDIEEEKSQVLTLLCSALQVLFPQWGTRANSAPHQDNSKRGEWGERQIIKLGFGQCVMLCCNTQLFIIKLITRFGFGFLRIHALNYSICYNHSIGYRTVHSWADLGNEILVNCFFSCKYCGVMDYSSSFCSWTFSEMQNQRDRVGAVLKLWIIEDIFIFSRIQGEKVAEFKWYE